MDVQLMAGAGCSEPIIWLGPLIPIPHQLISRQLSANMSLLFPGFRKEKSGNGKPASGGLKLSGIDISIPLNRGCQTVVARRVLWPRVLPPAPAGYAMSHFWCFHHMQKQHPLPIGPARLRSVVQGGFCPSSA